MKLHSRLGRVWLSAIAFTFSTLLCSAAALAAVQVATGIRSVVPNGSAAECGSKAQTALGAYLQNVTESAPGSGEWRALGFTAGAIVSCYPVGKGYVVTFTCFVQVPSNPYTADALCADIADSFSGKPVTPLATPVPTAPPTPTPSGCSTVNLVGTWVSNDSSGPTFTMDLNGGLLDNDGVSGSWALSGSTVTLTYYGFHTLKLAPDGKHMSGGGYALTRKC